jgi:hypothetical protein
VQSRCGPATVNEDESPNIHSAFMPGKEETRHREEGAASKPGDLPGVHSNFLRRTETMRLTPAPSIRPIPVISSDHAPENEV